MLESNVIISAEQNIACSSNKKTVFVILSLPLPHTLSLRETTGVQFDPHQQKWLTSFNLQKPSATLS